jgi:hypothetical protein
MTYKQKQVVTASSLFMILVVAGGLLGFASVSNNATENEDVITRDMVPDFFISEKNLVNDKAIVSIQTHGMSSSNMRKLARFVVENHVKQDKDDAVIYFYRIGKKVHEAAPVHKMTWQAPGRYHIEY